MASQLSALEEKYQKLRHLIEVDLNKVTSWLDEQAALGDEHDSYLFQKSLDRQSKLRADLQRIDARLEDYRQIAPFPQIAIAS